MAEVQLPSYPSTASTHIQHQQVVNQMAAEALRQYTLRLEQELASSKQSIAVAQQEAAKRDEAMKQVRKERDVALFTLRKYEDGAPVASSSGPSSKSRAKTPTRDRTDGRVIERTKTPTRDRAKTPTKPRGTGKEKSPGRGRARKDDDEGWATQPGTLPKKSAGQASAQFDGKKEKGAYELLADEGGGGKGVKFAPPSTGVHLPAPQAPVNSDKLPAIAKGPQVGKGFAFRRGRGGGGAGPPPGFDDK